MDSDNRWIVLLSFSPTPGTWKHVKANHVIAVPTCAIECPFKGNGQNIGINRKMMKQ